VPSPFQFFPPSWACLVFSLFSHNHVHQIYCLSVSQTKVGEKPWHVDYLENAALKLWRETIDLPMSSVANAQPASCGGCVNIIKGCCLQHPDQAFVDRSGLATMLGWLDDGHISKLVVWQSSLEKLQYRITCRNNRSTRYQILSLLQSLCKAEFPLANQTFTSTEIGEFITCISRVMDTVFHIGPLCHYACHHSTVR